MTEERGISMRLKPSEVRIINAVRGIRAGQVTVNKTEAGQIDVRMRSKDISQNLQMSQPVSQQALSGRISLRG